MNYEIILCDLCSAPVKNGSKQLQTINGAGINLFQSVGCDGWGKRNDTVEFSGEVCEKCFHEFEIITQAVQLWLDKRNNSKPPTIIVTEHEVSTVSVDDPPPKGHRTRLLR